MLRKKSLLPMIVVLIFVGAVASLAAELPGHGTAPMLAKAEVMTCSLVKSTIPVEPFAKPHAVLTCTQNGCTPATNCSQLCGDAAFCNTMTHHCEFR